MRKIGLLFSTFALGLILTGCSNSTSTTSQSEAFAMKEKCSTKAQAFLKKEDENDAIIGASILNEQYKYSEELNTCIVYFEVYERNAGTTYNIVDLLNNKKIYQYETFKNQEMQKQHESVCKEAEGCYVKKESFDAKFNILFTK